VSNLPLLTSFVRYFVTVSPAAAGLRFVSCEVGRIALVPNRLARYVLREVLPLYAAGLVVFLALTTTDLISSIAGVLLRANTPLHLAAPVYFARLPFLLAEILPLAVPFAILIAFGRLAKDSELKAMFAAGVRPLNLLWPLALFGLAVSAVNFHNINNVVPGSNKRFWDAYHNAVTRAPAPPPTQDRYTYREGNTLYYAGRIQNFPHDTNRASLIGVLVQQPGVAYSALNGTWDAKARSWEINGYWETRPNRTPTYHSGTRRFRQSDRLRPPSLPPEQLATRALRNRAADTTLDVRERRVARFELQRRLADPFTALGFALAAGSLGLLLRNRAWSFGAVVLLIFAFYIVWSAAPQLAKLGAMNEVLAAWLPNILLVAFSVALWRRLT